MRGDVPTYDLVRATSLEEALTLCEQGARPFAGGTDLMVVFESGKLVHKRYVSLWHLRELAEIEVSDNQVTIGALVTYRQIREHELLRKEFPNLPAAARETGAVAIQNRGTLGGNIANASPAADTPPALLCYDASLALTSRAGTRVVPYAEFHQSYKKTMLQEGELITRILLPRGKKRVHFYRKVGTRKAQAISKVCMAGTARLEGNVARDVRLALGSVGPVSLRATKCEQALEGKPLDAATIASATAALALDIAPIDDIRSTRAYRQQVAANVLTQFLDLLAGAAKS